MVHGAMQAVAALVRDVSDRAALKRGAGNRVGLPSLERVAELMEESAAGSRRLRPDGDRSHRIGREVRPPAVDPELRAAFEHHEARHVLEGMGEIAKPGLDSQVDGNHRPVRAGYGNVESGRRQHVTNRSEISVGIAVDRRDRRCIRWPRVPSKGG